MLARLDAAAARFTSPRAQRWAKGPAAGAILVLLCAVVLVPGQFRIPAVDRDEARFAQASRQMFESLALPWDRQDREPITVETLADGSTRITSGLHAGGLAVPILQHKPRLNKPPLIYWLQTTSAAIFTGGDPASDAIWMYRVPSALCAVLSVLLTWRLGCSLLDPRAAWFGAALLAACPMLIWDAHQARADQLLLTTTPLALWPLWLIFKNRAAATDSQTRVQRWWVPLWLAVAVGLGVLAKGPITPMVVLTTAIALCVAARDFRWLLRVRPLLLLLVVGVMVGPWVLAVAAKVGFSNFLDIVFDETLGRSTSAKEGHSGLPGYHVVLTAALFWPGSLLTAAAVIGACRKALVFPPPAHPSANRFARLLLLPARLRARTIGNGSAAELFLLAWLIPAWVIFELVSTKLPHYTLPLYPALALLTGQMLLRVLMVPLDDAKYKSLLLGLRLWLVIGAVITAGLPIVLLLAGPTRLAFVVGILTAAACLGVLLQGWRAVSDRNLPRAQAMGGLALLVFVVPSFFITLPGARAVWITPRLIAAMDETRPGWRERPHAGAGFHEDSLVFATRATLEKIGINSGDEWLTAHPNGLLIAPDELTPTLEDAGHTKANPEPVRGYNYATGKKVTLSLWQSGAAAAAQPEPQPEPVGSGGP
ncbi:MAG: 4-amino-4-deoxy-L-arabinose transferase-like glycosyltransferase [Phycisphaerales bacterium]